VKPIHFHPDAEGELDEAISYLQRQRAGLGLDLQAEGEKATRSIQKNPRMHALYKNTTFRKHVLRRFSFNLFYQELDEFIWIASLAHQKRRPDYWIDRTPD
jgi:toxin ParE1/3/4